MADFVYGVTKVNGVGATGYESLTSNFEFITIETAVPIHTFAQSLADQSVTVSTATANQLAQARASQAAFDKLIQIVSLRGQPVIMGAVGLDTGVYSLILAVEHPSAWACAATGSSDPSYTDANQPWPDARTGEDLKSRIIADGINFGFGANVSVTYVDPINGGTYTHTYNDTGVLTVTFSSILT